MTSIRKRKLAVKPPRPKLNWQWAFGSALAIQTTPGGPWTRVGTVAWMDSPKLLGQGAGA